MELFKLMGKIAVDNSDANSAIDDTAGRSKEIGKGFKESQLATGKSLSDIANQTGSTVNELRSKAMALASEYKKSGMSASDATKKAYSDIGYVAEHTHKEIEEEIKDTLNKADDALDDTTEIFKDSSKKMSSSLDDTAGRSEKAENRMVNAFKKIGAAVATAFAVDKIKEFGKACVEMSAEVDAERSAFEQIMGDYSDTAQEKVNEIADATGMVNTRLTPYMTAMTAKFKGLGYDIGDATDYAQQGLNIAADAAAFWDKSLDDSMSALNSFVNGSYEGGEAIGLFANDTQMAAYAVKQGLIGESKEWANLEEKIKQATRLDYAENMQKASGAVGQAAKESNQYANVQANLNEKWRQFKAQIGEPILQNIVLPVMKKLGTFISDKLQPALADLKDRISENKDRIIALKDKTVEFGKYLINTFSPAFENLKKLFVKVKDAIKPLIDSVIGYSESNEKATGTTNLLKDAIEFAADAIKTACDIMGGFVDWLTGGSKGAETFKAVIKELSTVFLIYKGVMLALNIAEKVQTAITLALTAAHTALNAVTPFGWAMIAITALGALVTAIAKMSEPNNRMVEEFAKLSDEEQALRDKTNELVESYKTWNDARNGAVKNINEEFGTYQTLADELDNIVDKNGKIKEGYEGRAAIITGTLSEALGIEIEIVDGVIQKYGELQKSIEDTIELQKAQAIQESMKDGYLEALKNVTEAQHNYNENLAEHNETCTEYSHNQSLLTNITAMSTEEFEQNALMLLGSQDAYLTQSEAIKMLTDKQGGLLKKLSGTRVAFNASEASFVDYNTTIKNYEGVTSAIVSKDADEIKSANANLLESFQAAETGTERSLRNQMDNAKTYYEDLKKSQKSGNKSITDEMVKDAQNRYTKASNECDRYAEMMGQGAENAGDKYCEGIRSKSEEAGKSGREMAQTVFDNISSIDFGAAADEAGITYANRLTSAFNGAFQGFSSLINNLGDVSVTAVASGSVPKYATGGIVDRATIAQIGEDGPEAVVPLKNNTEWIDLVAGKVSNAIGGGSNYAVISKLDELINTMKGQKIYLNNDVLVGEIAGGMDNALGNINRRKRRLG